MKETLEDQVGLFDQDTWSGKMSPEPSVQIREKTSASSSKKWQGSPSRIPLFLDLRKASGQTAAPSWETGGALLGEYTMRSFGEYPSVAVESRLSAILEANPHRKYSLSAKACQGILNRAERRGKKLPPELEAALRAQSASKSGAESPEGGKGILIQHEHVGALSTLNNKSVLCLNDQGGSVMGVSEDVTGALRAQEHGHQLIVWNGKADGASGNGVAFATVGDHENRPTDMTNLVIGTYQTVTGALTPGAHPPAVAIGNGQANQSVSDKAGALNCMHDQQAILRERERERGGDEMMGSNVRRLTPL